MVGKIFKRKKTPKEGVPYAVQGGAYVGEMLVYVEQVGDNFCFISIPKNTIRDVPKDKFFFGLDNNILECLENLKD